MDDGGVCDRLASQVGVCPAFSGALLELLDPPLEISVGRLTVGFAIPSHRSHLPFTVEGNFQAIDWSVRASHFVFPFGGHFRNRVTCRRSSQRLIRLSALEFRLR